MRTPPECYFKAAKKAAAKEILDPSKAHRVAMQTIESMVAGKTPEFYSEMAWQCVLLAQSARAKSVY